MTEIGFYRTKNECSVATEASKTRYKLPEDEAFKVTRVDEENGLCLGVFRNKSGWIKIAWLNRHTEYVGVKQHVPDRLSEEPEPD